MTNDLSTLFKRMPPSYQKRLSVGQSCLGCHLELKQKIKSFNQIDEFITELREQFGQFIRSQIEMFKKDNIQYESSFVLQLEKDVITKEKITNPILFNQNQNLVLDPFFCNQDVFSQFFDANKFNYRNINFFSEQLVLTLKFWEILQFYSSNIGENFSILILPNKCNFAVLDQNNQLYFNSSEKQKLEFLQLNSVFTQNGQESKKYLEELFSKHQFKLFNEFPMMDIVDKGKIIDYYDQGEQKTSLVTKKNFDTIHSTLCEDNQTHIIIFQKDQYPRCSKCLFYINKDNYDTLYISIQWYNLYERVQDYLFLRAQIIEGYYLVNPIKFQIENKDQIQQLVLEVQNTALIQHENDEIQQESNQNTLKLCLNLNGHYEYEYQDYEQEDLEKQNEQFQACNLLECEEILSTNTVCSSSKNHTEEPQLTRNNITYNQKQKQTQMFGQDMEMCNDYQLKKAYWNNDDPKNNSPKCENQNENALCEYCQRALDDKFDLIEEYEY